MTREGMLLLGAFLTVTATAQGESIRITLLGTGCPTPVIDRFGPSTLIEAGGQKYLFDAGRGAIQRLRQIGVRWQDVDGVLITHLHSDHVVGLPDLWLTGWLTGAGRNRPLYVWGPAGTSEMISHLEKAFAFDIRGRVHDNHSVPDGVTIAPKDIQEGTVFETSGVKVAAFTVDHGPVKPAFGYRIDAGGRVVVISGDTRPSENLIRHAAGADVLIHEVVAPDSLRRAGVPADRLESVVAYHTTPEQAGEVFARVNPRLAVYSHIVHPHATSEELIQPARKAYTGPLEIGEDLMLIEIGAEISVKRQAGPG